MTYFWRPRWDLDCDTRKLPCYCDAISFGEALPRNKSPHFDKAQYSEEKDVFQNYEFLTIVYFVNLMYLNINGTYYRFSASHM